MSPEIKTFYLMLYAKPLTTVGEHNDIHKAIEIMIRHRVKEDKDMISLANSWLYTLSM